MADLPDGLETDYGRLIDNVWIPLKDGRRLAARIWLPADADQRPAPAILEYLPYRKRDGTAPRDATTFPAYARYGYAGVRVDAPGTGDSDGEFTDEYTEDELATGCAVIEWIAAQPWCSGAVAMIGISWGGFNGLMIGMRRPPALKAVISICSSVDRYADDVHYLGGCLLTDNFAWAAQMTAYSSRPPDPALRPDWQDVWLQRLENLPFLAEVWHRHQRRDPYWRFASLCEDWGSVEAAVLAVGGWADAYTNAPPQIVRDLKAPAAALIGPWEHRYPQIARIDPAIDFPAEVVAWCDRWLKGEDMADPPAVRAYINTFGPADRTYCAQPGYWTAWDQWPDREIESRTLHLGQGGLGPRPGDGTATVSSPLDIGLSGGVYCAGMRVDSDLPDDQDEDDARSVCFDSAPLDSDLTILGRPEITMTLTSDKPAAQLVLRLCDVAPDGSSRRVSFLPFNLAHRNGHDQADPLVPGEPVTVTVPLKTCGYRFRAGHRIRLAVSTSYWPLVWPTPEKPTLTVDLGASRLVLPALRNPDAGRCDPLPPPPPKPESDIEETAPPSSRYLLETLEDGGRILHYADDYGELRNKTHGLTVASQVEQKYSIHPDDPLSAVLEIQWCFTFRRDGWQVRIESDGRMTASLDALHLSRRVRALDGLGKEVFDKRWSADIPRDGV